MSDTRFHLFWPKDIGPYEARLGHILTKCQLDLLGENCDIATIIQAETKTLSSALYPNSEEARLRYRSYLLVLLDLLRQGWRLKCSQGKLYLRPPKWTETAKGADEVQLQKKAIRDSLGWERRAQFEKLAVRKFIREMERDCFFNGVVVSIRSLIADGPSLAGELEAVTSINDEVLQEEKLLTVIQPYLQLITPGARCEHTGLHLQDIWRYFRYMWATPYNSAPTRRMYYLVRDAGKPFHPVIGISALGGSMVQLSVRDDRIGWTPNVFGARIESETFDHQQALDVLRMLRTTLAVALGDIATDDLATPLEILNPDNTVAERLKRTDLESRELRRQLLKQRRSGVDESDIGLQQMQSKSDSPDFFSRQQADFEELAETALFRSKRAHVLARLLVAKQVIDELEESPDIRIDLKKLWASSRGKRTIRTLLKENKKRKIGINMMDITVCGAIPPYSVLLGGKLVAMLMVSPTIVRDYMEKYKDYASIIASKMKGQEVKREPALVFLGTTSLYPSGNSQYNRIAIPVPDNSRQVLRYEEYGLTRGYGSVHFSEETRRSLNQLQEMTQQARLINNRFGEGVNPKMRSLSSGLASIGITNTDKFERHRSQRVVYGVPLGRTAYEFLRGETSDPNLYFDYSTPDKARQGTIYIQQFWVKRWLLQRIRKPEFIDRVASVIRDNLLLSKEFQSESHTQQLALPIEEGST